MIITKNALLELSYPDEKEKKFKLILRNKYLEYGKNKTYLAIAWNNQLLLNNCKINESEFNYILFKNYIFFLNNGIKPNFENFDNQDVTIIESFNNCINNNEFENALEIYKNNFIIHQLLCSAYLKNLSENEIEKINTIPNECIDNLYNKIVLLKNADLSFKREKNKEKTLNKVSNR